jgi:diguanylate cyclase (GGDEF)-like protein
MVREAVPGGQSAVAAPAYPKRGKAWNDVPLRNKVVLLVALAAVGGALVGMLEASLGRSGVVLSVGLTVLVSGLLVLAKQWIGAPFERLVKQLGRINREYDTAAIDALPVERRDEVGQIARAIHQLTHWSRRDYNEARHLRRTLDYRVAEATKRATRELRQMAMRDPLTDLGNRRFLDEHLEALVDTVRETREELACVLIDVDNFKTVNDTLGHGAGDELLVFLAGLIRASIRKEDYAVRLGGDEFVVLMPGCEGNRALEFAQRLVALFRQRESSGLPPDKDASLSIGVACLHGNRAASGGDLLAKADAALYKAKRAGKNQAAA